MGSYNVYSILWRFDPAGPRFVAKLISIGLDVLLSFILIVLSGGLDSPFLIYSLSPVLTASLLMNLGFAVGVAGAVGLFVGYPGVLVALWIAVVAGGILAIGLLAFRKKGRKDAIPFGPFLAVSAIIAFAGGSEVLARYREISANLIGP